MINANEKEQRFKKVASKRVRKIIDGLSTLSNCANTRNYEYSEEEVYKMFKAIKEELKNTEAIFRANIEKSTAGFRL